MIAALITISAFVLIILLLLLNIKLRILISDGFHLTVFYGIFKVFDSDKKSKPGKKEKSGDKKPEREEKPKEKSNFLKEYFDEHGIKETLSFIIRIVKTALKKLKKLIKRCKFRKFKIDIRVGGKNAAIAAIEYGAVCSVFYPFLEFLYSNLNFEIRQANVSTDFDATVSDLELDTQIIIKPIFLALFGVQILKFLKQIKDGKI